MAKMFSKLRKTWKSLDIFGVGVNFNIKNQSEYQTIFGGSVFICYIIATIYFWITNFFTFYNRTTFNQNTVENKFSTAPPINLKESEITFAFGITVDRAIVQFGDWSNTFFANVNPYFYYTKYVKSPYSKQKTPIDLRKCKKTDFHNLIDNTFDITDLQNYYCINKEATPSLNIEGIFTDEVFSYLEFEFIIKDDSQETQDMIKDYLLSHEVNFQIYYLDTAIKISDYSNPRINYLESKYLPLYFPYVQKGNWYVAENVFENDANILFPESTFFHFTTVDLFEKYTVYKGNDRFIDKKTDWNLLTKLYIRASQTNIHYKRIFQKITEYWADSTAILSQLLFCLMIIMTEYNRFKSKEFIINHMLNYKENFRSKSQEGYNKFKSLFNDTEARNSYNNSNIYNSTPMNTDICLKTSSNELKTENGKFKTENHFPINNKSESWEEVTLPIRKQTKNKNKNQKKLSWNYFNSPEEASNKQPFSFCSSSNNVDTEIQIRIPYGLKVNKVKDIKSITNREHKQLKPTKKASTNSSIKCNLITNETNSSNVVPIYYPYLSQNIQDKIKYPNADSPQKLSPSSGVLEFSLCGMILIALKRCNCCCRSAEFRKKEELFERGIQKYLENLDIFSYFKNWREVEIIKYLYFNESQLTLWEFLSKPPISLSLSNADSPLSSLPWKFNHSSETIEKWFKAFKDIDEANKEECQDTMWKLLKLTAYDVYLLSSDNDNNTINTNNNK